jgi:hypothetical protein
MVWFVWLADMGDAHLHVLLLFYSFELVPIMMLCYVGTQITSNIYLSWVGMS